MLIMENSEEVLQILERFTKLKQKDIPKELEDYLSYVAKTGDTVYRWANVKHLFREKLVHVIKDFHDTTPSVDDLPQYPNVDPFNYETMKSSLLERLEMFNAAPFTIQRLCELLTDPRKQYSRIDKFMRALEKNILVVSTIEPGRKQPESENGDSLDSVVNGDLSLDVNVDIDMESESIFSMEPQNSTTTVTESIAVAETSSSTSSSYVRSDSATDESAASLPKKQKLDITDDNIETKKSDSESESEASDDSDNSDKETISKENQNILKNKSDIDQNHSHLNVIEKAGNDKENKDGTNVAQEKEDSTKSVDSAKEHSNDRATESQFENCHSKKLNSGSENETQNAEMPKTSVTEQNVDNNETVDSKETRNVEELPPEDTGADTKQTTKLDNSNSCLKELDKSVSEEVKNNELQENLDHSHDDPLSITENLVTEDQIQVSELTDDSELILKENRNITLTYPAQCSETFSSSSSSSSTSSSSSSSSPTSSNVVNKIPEQISIEGSSSTLTPTPAPAPTNLLPQQLQRCSQNTLILNGNEIINSSSTIQNDQQQQPIPDQPMDENPDTEINICSITAVENLTTITDSNNVVDEVMQLSESEQMTTDIIKSTIDDKNDLSGMDVDDTSQEEAMDQ